jgi:hypothetical protein
MPLAPRFLPAPVQYRYAQICKLPQCEGRRRERRRCSRLTTHSKHSGSLHASTTRRQSREGHRKQLKHLPSFPFSFHALFAEERVTTGINDSEAKLTTNPTDKLWKSLLILVRPLDDIPIFVHAHQDIDFLDVIEIRIACFRQRIDFFWLGDKGSRRCNIQHLLKCFIYLCFQILLDFFPKWGHGGSAAAPGCARVSRGT